MTTPPVANDGTLEATAGEDASGSLDADNPGGGTLAYSIVTRPSHGNVTLDDESTGDFTYTADSDYTGDDAFTWKVNDGVADSDTATVDVTVSAASRPAHGPSAGGGGSLGGLGLALLVLLAGGAVTTRRARCNRRL